MAPSPRGLIISAVGPNITFAAGRAAGWAADFAVPPVCPGSVRLPPGHTARRFFAAFSLSWAISQGPAIAGYVTRDGPGASSRLPLVAAIPVGYAAHAARR